MIYRLILGDTLAVLNTSDQNCPNETDANFDLCLREMIIHTFP
jgi:hypothetical protein